MEDREKFAKRLLIQDPPSADSQAKHREALFKAANRRVSLEKTVTGGVYVLIFVAAFMAFMARSKAENIVHAICWGALSLHILLWFLVYFLWRIRTLLEKTTQGTLVKQEDHKRMGQERLVEIGALVMCVFTTLLVVLAFSLKEPLNAARMTVLMLWGPIFFLFWFAFRAASLASKLWLEYKKLELTVNRPADKD